MSDIVDELKVIAARGTDFNHMDDVVKIKTPLLERAISEIERLRSTIEHLRSVAGAVSLDTVTLDQIKRGSAPTHNGGCPIGPVVDAFWHEESR